MFFVNSKEINEINEINNEERSTICLIDKSGSTEQEMNVHDKDVTILEFELEIAKKMLTEKNVRQTYIMLWDNSVEFPYNYEKMCVADISDDILSVGGSTCLEVALSKIPESWLEHTVDMYIFTDGEINGNIKQTEMQLKRLFSMNVNVHIVTIEGNDNNYMTDDCCAGNALYKLVKDNCFTTHIKSFTMFNEYHENGFSNLINPDIPEGYIPFQNKLFKIEDTSKFIEYLYNIDKNITKQELLKLTHDLTFTVHHMCKNKSVQIQNRIIDMVSSIFYGSEIEREIHEILKQETANIRLGKANTYQEYKNNHTKILEAAQVMLYEDVKKSISKVQNDEYVSFIVNDINGEKCVIKSSSLNVSNTLQLRHNKFPNSSISIKNMNVPMLPTNVLSDNEMTDQCLRQWIRAIYSIKYKINSADDIILYMFLVDVLLINVSNIDNRIKNGYTNMAKIMLSRIRFGTQVSELDFLKTNPPSPVIGTEKAIDKIFQKMVTYFGSAIKPYTLWYAIMLCIDKKLAECQLQYCKTDIEEDNVNEVNIQDYIKGLTKSIRQYDYCNDNNLEYMCYITLDDLTHTGGYSINKHYIFGDVICNPRFMLSTDSFETMKNEYTMTCPICNNVLNESQYTFVNEKQEIDNENETLIEIKEDVFDRTKHENVRIDVNDYNIVDDLELVKLDDVSFDAHSFDIDCPTMFDTLNCRFPTVHTSEQFKSILYFKYPFLKDVNLKNCCLGGGACRSILMKQRPKDFDFFMYGLDDPMERFREFLDSIMNNLKNQIQHVKFILMYKPLFNVYEIVVVKDPRNFFGDDFSLNFYEKYDFKSLNRYDKFTLINPISKTVKTSDNFFAENLQIFEGMFANYFEDNDASKVKMIYRIQVILTNYKTINDVLNAFDMYPSRIAFDGDNVCLTKRAVTAYKYMINIVNEKYYSNMFDSRLSKYFSYGFSIVVPELDTQKIVAEREIKINEFKVKALNVMGNRILIHHDSNIEEKLESIRKLEEKSKKDGCALYKSALFCSLISILRYIKINDISYLITSECIVPEKDGTMKFKERNEQIYFVNKICSRILHYDWYNNYRKGGYVAEDNDYFDEIVGHIDKLNDKEQIIVYQKKHSARGYSVIKKDPIMDYIFSGPGSKKILKYFTEKKMPENKIYAQILDKEGRRQFVSFKTWNDCFTIFQNVPFSNRFIYEIINSNVACKPYLDIEWKVGDNEYAETLDKLDAFIMHLKTDIITIFHNRYGLSISENGIIILESHSEKELKISFHVIINEKINDKQIVYKTNKIQHTDSAYDLCHALNEISDMYDDKIDDKVYTFEREFRTLNSNKDNTTDRPFICRDKDVDYNDTIVSVYDTNLLLIKTPQITLPTRNNKKTTIRCDYVNKNKKK